MTASGDRWYDREPMRAWVRLFPLLLALGVLWTAGRAGAYAAGEAGAAVDDCCPETAAADAGGEEDCPPLCTCHCCPQVASAVPELGTSAPAAPDAEPLAPPAPAALPAGRSRPLEYPPNR